MKSKKFSKGVKLTIIGSLLVLSAICLMAYNIIEAFNAGDYSKNVLCQMYESLPKSSQLKLVPNQEISTIEIDGIHYIGILKIPSLEIELPVASDFSYELLKQSPCRYYGEYYDDNMVIAAHNYLTHFGTLQNIQLNSEVYFIDVEGIVYKYIVDNIEVLNPDQVEDMIHSNYKLTLFTCDFSGTTRFTVRCIKAS